MSFFDSPIKYDSPLYVVTNLGSALLGIGVVMLLADRFSATRIVRTLAGAGTVTLSIYLLHGFIPASLFRWVYRNQHVGVGWALLIALGGWIVAMVVGGWWAGRIGLGPVERVLRHIGGR